jgi:hypothetical protein
MLRHCNQYFLSHISSPFHKDGLFSNNSRFRRAWLSQLVILPESSIPHRRNLSVSGQPSLGMFEARGTVNANRMGNGNKSRQYCTIISIEFQILVALGSSWAIFNGILRVRLTGKIEIELSV